MYNKFDFVNQTGKVLLKDLSFLIEPNEIRTIDFQQAFTAKQWRICWQLEEIFQYFQTKFIEDQLSLEKIIDIFKDREAKRQVLLQKKWVQQVLAVINNQDDYLDSNKICKLLDAFCKNPDALEKQLEILRSNGILKTKIEALLDDPLNQQILDFCEEVFHTTEEIYRHLGYSTTDPDLLKQLVFLVSEELLESDFEDIVSQESFLEQQILRACEEQFLNSKKIYHILKKSPKNNKILKTITTLKNRGLLIQQRGIPHPQGLGYRAARRFRKA